MSVGRDITEHVRPPRTAFLNYPMGRTVGNPGRPGEQREIVRAALLALGQMEGPGAIVDLAFELEECSPNGEPWQRWVYTKDFRARLMKGRDGSRYTGGK